MNRHLFRLTPDYRERVWGGPLLTAAAVAAGAATAAIGEAWVVFDGSVVADGPEAGRTLRELLRDDGQRLLGTRIVERFGDRLPLLAKILETADWLSVQVHPDDEQARRMVGTEEFGKTEAWYFLDAAPGARILAGVRPGTTREAVVDAIRSGRVLDIVAELPVGAGDAVLIPAGMLHALGPGLIVYEIQQHSDTTYRAYDWDRPLTAGRKLHIEESAEVARPHEAQATRLAAAGERSCVTPVVACRQFEVARVTAAPGEPFADDAAGAFELLTVTAGRAEVAAADEVVALERFESVFVAADTGPLEVRSAEGATVIRSAVPSGREQRA